MCNMPYCRTITIIYRVRTHILFIIYLCDEQKRYDTRKEKCWNSFVSKSKYQRTNKQLRHKRQNTEGEWKKKKKKHPENCGRRCIVVATYCRCKNVINFYVEFFFFFVFTPSLSLPLWLPFLYFLYDKSLGYGQREQFVPCSLLAFGLSGATI